MLLLLQGLSEPEFCGDLVYKFRKIVGKPELSDNFSTNAIRYKLKGCNIDVIKQTACLVVNPITTDQIARRWVAVQIL